MRNFLIEKKTVAGGILQKLPHLPCGRNPLYRVPAKTQEQLQMNPVAELLKMPTMLAKFCGGELPNALATR